MSYKIELTDNFKKMKIIDETVFLLSIFSKGDRDTISDKEIEDLLKDYM